jgi:hypothetical protein
MFGMIPRFFAFLLITPLIIGAARAAEAPVVVELFTSQGCSSCPPADEYLGELAKRPGLLALAFHVEYWNYIGWPDPYSKPWATRRQREYSTRLKQRFVFTPEMVVQGEAEGIGSERATIEALIRDARDKPRPHPSLSLQWRDDGALLVDIGGGASPPSEPATLWLIGYDGVHSNPILAGENEGRTSWDHHAVRSFRRLGAWAGWSEQIVVPPEEAKKLSNHAAAVLLQLDGNGPILTAASIELPKR